MQKLDRRQFLARAAALSTAAVAGGVLVACNKGGGSLTCTDTTGLAAADVTMRQTQAYTDNSTQAGKTCSNCSLYTQPTAEGTCGGCTVLQGPIHPDGYCNLWAAAA